MFQAPCMQSKTRKCIFGILWKSLIKCSLHVHLYGCDELLWQQNKWKFRIALEIHGKAVSLKSKVSTLLCSSWHCVHCVRETSHVMAFSAVAVLHAQAKPYGRKCTMCSKYLPLQSNLNHQPTAHSQNKLNALFQFYKSLKSFPFLLLLPLLPTAFNIGAHRRDDIECVCWYMLHKYYYYYDEAHA